MIPANELRVYVRATAADDQVLAQLELGAVAFIENDTGRYFGAPAETVETISGPMAGSLWLSDKPAIDPDTGDPLLVVEEWSGSVWSVVVASDYRIVGNALVSTGVWTYGTNNYRATFTRGYEEGAEPADIRDLVMQLVASKWKARGNEGMKSETISGYSYTRADVPDPITYDRTLEHWRGWPFA